MSAFIQYVLSELRSIMILVLLAGILAAAVIAVAYLIFKKKHKGEKKFPWGKIILYLLLVGYVFIVISATILRKAGGFRREYNFHLFRAWIEAWNNYSVKNWANVLLNIALFVPLGALLPLLWKKCKKWYITIPVGLGTSFVIELVQLALKRGICDVDDLFANTLGVVIGFFCIMAVISLFNEKGHRIKPCLLHGGIALLPILTICGIFVSYNVQEFGNLPQAAAYTKNTKGVNWVMECELPTANKEMAVYQTQVRSKADCDAFAEDFKKIINTEYSTISYYEEAAYYMDNGSDGGAHFLHVNYLDQGYDYSASFHDDAPWIDSDRTAIVEALSRYPVQIPESAEFTIEGDGWHSFTSQQYIDGDVLIDGTLRVRVAENGSIREIENQLLSYTYYRSVNIITPEEALALLKTGRFSDEDYFERINPSTIAITQCVLEYQVDTKGFYQPVYTFYLEYGSDTYGNIVMIPAMKR